MKNMSYILALLMAALICGCGAAPVKEAKRQQPISVPIGKETKPIQFRKIVVKIPRGASIGSVQAGLLCVKRSDLVWRSGKIQLSGEEFTDVFRDELQKANYTVVGNPDALFDDPSEWKAEFLVAGLINNMQASVCYPYGGMGDWSSSKGEAFIKVNWQVYSRLERKVVYETSTEGSNKKGTTTAGESDLLLNAFAVATQNLLADKGFNELAIGTKKVTQKPYSDKIVIAKLSQSIVTINDHINDVRAGVVTILAVGGSGSGFFINPEYLLTCHHVVKDAKLVKIRLVTGREVIGEVIRSNSRRDVALVKTEEGGMMPLPIRETDISVGEDVYAVGSPLGEKFSTSVTKGIVSAYRIVEGVRLIQSDVNILRGSSGGPLLDNKGNIVGMTTSGMMFGEATLGLNFFVPIDDTLRELKIESKTK